MLSSPATRSFLVIFLVNVSSWKVHLPPRLLFVTLLIKQEWVNKKVNTRFFLQDVHLPLAAPAKSLTFKRQWCRRSCSATDGVFAFSQRFTAESLRNLGEHSIKTRKTDVTEGDNPSWRMSSYVCLSFLIFLISLPMTA